MDIQIPSPSAILESLYSPPSTPGYHAASTSSASASRKRRPVGNRPVPGLSLSGPNKPKQSKSRNGCATCKAKRLKCDESKPTCLQCTKRNVECGGYKKDFKWRPFEESFVAAKANTAKVKKGKSTATSVVMSASSQANKGTAAFASTLQSSSVGCGTTTSAAASTEQQEPVSLHYVSQSLPNLTSGALHVPGSFGSAPVDQDSVAIVATAQSTSTEDARSPESFSWLSGFILSPDANASDSGRGRLDSSFDSQAVSPRLDELSFSDLMEGEVDGGGDGGLQDMEEFILCRPDDPSYDLWFPDFSSDAEVFDRSTASLATPNLLLREPEFAAATPEMLSLRFDRFTCGILSVKDGVTENPWRTLVWPLAKDTPALYHAVFSLAAFHWSKDNPALRVHGVDHMRRSIACMVEGIQGMRTDAALATSLALAFAETWDSHTRTCTQHLRGAKALVSQAVRLGARSGMAGEDVERVRFLYNTWLYMDVIARLTSLDESGDQDSDPAMFRGSSSSSSSSNGSDSIVLVEEVDPLMGCAASLFPLIRQVTRLIQRARRSTSNSIALVSRAIELKRQIEQWEPPSCFEPPEDPTSEIQHSIQTAHAYRWATLLYLNQAVPEMPSEPAADLAKRVLILLATVPLTSRATIVHVFPLLAAGCEAEQEEDRLWVTERWRAIQTRLKLGSIDRCLEIVREVWARRDAFQTAQQQQQRRQQRARTTFPTATAAAGSAYPVLLDSGRISSGKNKHTSSTHGCEDAKSVFYDSPARRSSLQETSVIIPTLPRRHSALSSFENIEFEKTIRGRLHWIRVMEDWGWEGERAAQVPTLVCLQLTEAVFLG